MEEQQTYTAFSGETLVASGPLEAVLRRLKARFDQDPGELVLVFGDESGRQVDFDLCGTLDDVLARALPARAQAGPGRPKLGVVSREVSLLPRHWEWLERHPSGASAALRRLVEEARKREPGKQRARQAADAASRFMSAMAGNLPDYEEATRALYHARRAAFEKLIANWPGDIRKHVLRMAEGAFESD